VLRRGSLHGAALAKAGGAEGSRTPDLLIANETLYQLSYDPNQLSGKYLQVKSRGADFLLLRGSLRPNGRNIGNIPSNRKHIPDIPEHFRHLL
jgi:hypothetical protein